MARLRVNTRERTTARSLELVLERVHAELGKLDGLTEFQRGVLVQKLRTLLEAVLQRAFEDREELE